jgi:hypothetical protein
VLQRPEVAQKQQLIHTDGSKLPKGSKVMALLPFSKLYRTNNRTVSNILKLVINHELLWERPTIVLNRTGELIGCG